ncbi:MAG TPA: TIM-barrel domain-containing protein [Sphingomicrobium sp.]|nr:TIM-barrel domain-containing protein [Sphingomicrobium sp.]
MKFRSVLATLVLVAGPVGQSAFAKPITHLANGADASNGSARTQVTAITDSILRVRIARGAKLGEDASWAVPAAVRHQHVAVTATADGFRTSAVAIHINPATLQLTVTDAGGKAIVSDLSDGLRFDGKSFTLRKALPIDEHIYGLGDKTGPLDRRGETFVDWNTDAFGFAPSTDPIYKSIPFYIGVSGNGAAYGLFLDNSWRVNFDFGHKDPNAIEIGAPGGPIDYYVIAGPTVADVVRRYADLTGKPPLIPEWALGYQQSRWGYKSAAEVRGIADHLRSDHIPADVIWMDIDYQDRERPFTVDRTTFPDLKKLNADVNAEGIRLVAITDLHVAYLPNQGYAPFDSGMAGHHFVRKADGNLYVAPVWPGPSVFPDFTRTATRTWWGGLYKDFIADGFAGFWNDMNEPAVFETPTKTMPIDNIHRIDSDDFAPRDATHAEIHNVYGMENTRGTFEGMERLRPGVRPFVMTRASYAGGQRYAVTWTGDNSSTWDHLRLCIEQLTNLGLSGFTYSGCDVGGFIGGASPELLTRWYELAAFTPVFRNHSAHDAPRAEPWVDGPEHLAIRRRFIEERYRLMPYLYTLAEQNSRTGDPIMRPIFYDHPDALKLDCDPALTFAVGRALVVAVPARPENPRPQAICLPAGSWYDYWTGLPVSEHKLTIAPKLDSVPVFVREGTILPRQPLVQSTMEKPSGPLELDVYPGTDCGGDLYFDDGISVNGPSLRQHVQCVETPSGVALRFGPRQGSWRPWWNQIQVTVHGPKPIRMTIPDQPRAADVLVAPAQG